MGTPTYIQVSIHGYKDTYRSAQNMKFSETKGACDLAYKARLNEKYVFPDKKVWQVIARKDDFSGYLSVLLKTENDPRVILSFAGTDPTSVMDLITDFAQETSLIPRQYQWAASEALRYKSKYGSNLILTGHSLGGGLAAYGSLVHKIPTTTINPAPLSEKTVLKYVASGNQCVAFPVTNYISGGQEFISSDGLWGSVYKILERLPGGIKYRNLPKLMLVGEKIPVAGGPGILGSGLGKYYANHMIPDTAPEVPVPHKQTKPGGVPGGYHGMTEHEYSGRNY